MRQLRIGLAFLGQDLRIERGLGGEVLEQQRLRNGGGGCHALGRGAGKAIAGKASLGCAKDQLPAQVTCHAQTGHVVSKHSPTQKSSFCCGAPRPEVADSIGCTDLSLILRSGASRVSKDEATDRASWFE